jgi:preprotein translocase subunit SecE
LASAIKESSVSIREREVTTGSPVAESRRPSLIDRLRSMLTDVRDEIRKVTWPTRTETRNLTIVVIGISVLVGGLLGLVDLILVGLVRLLTGGGGL